MMWLLTGTAYNHQRMRQALRVVPLQIVDLTKITEINSLAL